MNKEEPGTGKASGGAPDSTANEQPAKPGPEARGFPIIGMGASAGGLEAFEQFFRQMPADSGMAFVLVPHLDPGHASMLTEILQRSTSMPVVEATDGMAVAPNRVHVIPPNRDMTLAQGALRLRVPEGPRGQRLPIDCFLRSLADEQGERAVGVILSGTGSDGTLGLRAILGAGGVSLVQDPATARYDGMPLSAIRSDLATYVLAAEKLPEQLRTYVKTVFGQKVKPAPAAPAARSDLASILALLRTRTGHDFSLYKQSTIRRRIERRMTVHGLAEAEAYGRYLKEHPHEAVVLFKELLINVTSFFRDPEAFDALKKDVLSRLAESRPEGQVFRVWVAGCATGEEAYSIAMLWREVMGETWREGKIQIYGTDLDEDAIATARAGAYPANIAADVPAERLRQFFVKEESGYRVKKEIREMVVFAVQNVIKDPPFTKLDLLSCRNLLIYLEPELQNRVILAFHYALKPGGTLLLSPSESLVSHPDLFAPLSRKWKFYQARPALDANRPVMGAGFSWAGRPAGPKTGETLAPAKETNFADLTHRALLQSYAPASVITDQQGNLLYVHGDTGKYLRPAPGQASLNIIEMAREGMQLELRTAIHSAAAQKKPVVLHDLPVKTNGGTHGVTVTMRTVVDPTTTFPLLLISFQDAAPEAPGKPARPERKSGRGDSKRVEEIEQELLYTRENLQASIEELQASNEEIKSTNEELQSTNEELQSTNEELETSKEELQSVNEELVTVNSELQAKIEQITGFQNDLKNLLDSTSIGTIFLDDNLAIKRFTRSAAMVYRLVASDVGRPLADIKSSLAGGVDLVEEARAVLETLTPREQEVRTAGGECYLARILPYRTLDNVIEGVVLTFTDITKLNKIEEDNRAAREYAESIVDTIREPLLVLDGERKVVSASRSFYRTFGVTPEGTVGCRLYDLGNRQWDIPRLRELLETILAQNTSFEDMEVEHDFPGLGRRRMQLNARRLRSQTGGKELILLAMEDITGHPPGGPTGGSAGKAGRRKKE